MVQSKYILLKDIKLALSGLWALKRGSLSVAWKEGDRTSNYAKDLVQSHSLVTVTLVKKQWVGMGWDGNGR